ncbi:terminase small subunit [Companilactobacillus allii]|uniref:Terminase ATPase subunit N-terminal domain-containing protein n=1 Tax=Companilactobacillus allii TaxID=1847728 RepID=A0A1P8Q4C3_9LACO|nr:terminase small subunit [Companilactobacillus allii]APX72704.1 hypothetical protein BTM29_09140 [Companilactobacillus allii]USQ69810.1 terminase small subunit [Companilactobacillus allii]
MINHDQAEQDYHSGMKYKDIAEKYDVSINTVKSWKSRYKWSRDASSQKNVHTKPIKGAHKVKKVAPKIIDELEANGELSDRQKSFCLFYLQRFNATWAYLKAYECTYETANTNGPKLLVNTGVQEQISKLKKSMMIDLHVTATDLAKEYAKQAHSDLGDYIDFGVRDEPVFNKAGKPLKDSKGKQLTTKVSYVDLIDKSKVDTSLLKGVHIGRDGVVVELYDKQKALDKLMDYISDSDDKTESNNVQIVDDIKGDDGTGN